MQSLLQLEISFKAIDADPLIYEIFIYMMEEKRDLTHFK